MFSSTGTAKKQPQLSCSSTVKPIEKSDQVKRKKHFIILLLQKF